MKEGPHNQAEGTDTEKILSAIVSFTGAAPPFAEIGHFILISFWSKLMVAVPGTSQLSLPNCLVKIKATLHFNAASVICYVFRRKCKFLIFL